MQIVNANHSINIQ